MSRREVPRQWEHATEDEAHVSPEPHALIGHGSIRPDTELQALMECPPGQEPDTTLDALLPMRDVLADAVDGLPAHQRWAFESLVIRRLSERQLAEEIQRPRRTVRRWRDEALVQLRSKLSSEPLILDHLHRGEFE